MPAPGVRKPQQVCFAETAEPSAHFKHILSIIITLVTSITSKEFNTDNTTYINNTIYARIHHYKHKLLATAVTSSPEANASYVTAKKAVTSVTDFTGFNSIGVTALIAATTAAAETAETGISFQDQILWRHNYARTRN